MPLLTEEEFIHGRTCGNPGCGTFVKRQSITHQAGLIFQIWQCSECGWISEISEPEILIPIPAEDDRFYGVPFP